jgi:hypothetical protein
MGFKEVKKMLMDSIEGKTYHIGESQQMIDDEDFLVLCKDTYSEEDFYEKMASNKFCPDDVFCTNVECNQFKYETLEEDEIRNICTECWKKAFKERY